MLSIVEDIDYYILVNEEKEVIRSKFSICHSTQKMYTYLSWHKNLFKSVMNVHLLRHDERLKFWLKKKGSKTKVTKVK